MHPSTRLRHLVPLALLLTVVTAADPAGVTIERPGADDPRVVTTRNFAFDPGSIRVRVGELVRLELVNADGVPHSFDVDTFDVHVPMPGDSTVTATFRPWAEGRFVLYCAPHYVHASGRGMSGVLIVEPAAGSDRADD